jgi:hypothetical protein
MKNMKEFARSAAESYLQHIVFVDDEIFPQTTNIQGGNLKELPAFQSPYAGSQAPVVHTENKDMNGDAAAAERVPFHPKQLVASFARKGMNCALYEPQAGFDNGIDSELFKLCDRADVMILDWDLYQEDGRNILPLIKNLVDADHSSMPHHARLCIVYTMKPDLIKVANDIFEYLRNCDIPVDDAEAPACLTVGATRIVILGKPDVTGRPVAQKKRFEVAEKDLAERVIDEFAAIHKGLLTAHILHSLASVRKNSKRILDKFHRELDGPFLLQRSLMLNSKEELFEQLPELMADELFSIMSDDPVDMAVTQRMALDCAEQFPLKSIDFINKAPSAQFQEEVAPEKYPGLFLGGDRRFNSSKFTTARFADFHRALGCEHSKSDRRLAALFNLRTGYNSSKTPKLVFGAIGSVPDKDSKTQYWICLMPACDCVRLEGATTFPFWNLSLEPKSKSRGVVIQVGDDYIELYVSGGIAENLWLEKFEPDDSRVVSSAREGDNFIFNGEKRKLTWLGQLKPSHAQRIAQDIGQKFSRVGVMEAEWLSIKCK